MEIFLQPGELFVGDAGFKIRTILGSCVSITLWHPGKRIGGMSHFLLASRGTISRGQDLDGRYGDEALQSLIQQLDSYGVSHRQCQAKVFGGGNMFPDHCHAGAINVGQRNGEAARAMLLAKNIPIMSESLFGVGHRQIVFDVSNGDVWSKQIRPSKLEIDLENGTQ
jgi:chemotaxis protein CheD